MWDINDDDAEDITDQVETMYTAKKAMHEIMADVSEVGINPTCNLLHMVATTSEARNWNDNDINIEIVDKEGYPFTPQQLQPLNRDREPTTAPQDENRWTYYHRPVGQQKQHDGHGIMTGEDMELLGDNDPFLLAMKSTNILANQHNHHLSNIEEGI